MTQTERRLLFDPGSCWKSSPAWASMEIPPEGEEAKTPAPRPVQHPYAPAGQRRISAGAGRLFAGGDPAQGHHHTGPAWSRCKMGIYLWQGDITTLQLRRHRQRGQQRDAGLLCPLPRLHRQCHPHLCRGAAAARLRQHDGSAQGHEEPTGRAKLTPAFNLPCRYVLHTVGPIVTGTADRRGPERCWPPATAPAWSWRRNTDSSSVAFCCISTGEFHFPNRSGGRDRRTDCAGMYKQRHTQRDEGDIQCFQGQRTGDIYRKLLAAD